MIRASSIIARIENHRSKSKDLSSKDLSDYLVFNSLAMECFQAANSAIDLAELIVAEKNLGFPSKYKEIFEMLNQARLISKKALDSMKRLVFLRNLISHEYYTITQKELKEMASLLGSLDELIKAGKGL